jgi:hypothetical protein
MSRTLNHLANPTFICFDNLTFTSPIPIFPQSEMCDWLRIVTSFSMVRWEHTTNPNPNHDHDHQRTQRCERLEGAYARKTEELWY